MLCISLGNEILHTSLLVYSHISWMDIGCFQLTSVSTFGFCLAFPWHEPEFRFQPTAQVACSSVLKVRGDCYKPCCCSSHRSEKCFWEMVLRGGLWSPLLAAECTPLLLLGNKGRSQLHQALHLASISLDTGVLQRKWWDNECILAGYTNFLSGSQSNWEVNSTAKIFNEN